MAKLTISRERFEKMKEALRYRLTASPEYRHRVVTEQLAAADMEVEQTAEERAEELEGRLKKMEERDARFVAAYLAWLHSPGDRDHSALPSIIREHFPETRDG